MLITKINFTMILVGFLTAFVVGLIRAVLTQRTLENYVDGQDLGKVTKRILIMTIWMDKLAYMLAVNIMLIIPALVIDLIIR